MTDNRPGYTYYDDPRYGPEVLQRADVLSYAGSFY
jgi:hypothetical protein